MLEMWLAGFVVALGIWWVWKSEWYVEGESTASYIIRVIAVCSLSWLMVGVAIGRIGWVLRDRDRFPDKGDI